MDTGTSTDYNAFMRLPSSKEKTKTDGCIDSQTTRLRQSGLSGGGLRAYYWPAWPRPKFAAVPAPSPGGGTRHDSVARPRRGSQMFAFRADLMDPRDGSVRRDGFMPLPGWYVIGPPQTKKGRL